jgi:DNA-binding MarR family transcriptional regulator
MSEKKSSRKDLVLHFSREIWDVMRNVRHSLRAHFHPDRDGEELLTPGQFHLLRQISSGQRSVRDLAETSMVSPPAISRQVDGLVNKGLIQRNPDPDDRRGIILELTKRGKALLSASRISTELWVTEKLSVLSDPEIEIVIEGLELLRKAFQVQPDLADIGNAPGCIRQD